MKRRAEDLMDGMNIRPSRGSDGGGGGGGGGGSDAMGGIGNRSLLPERAESALAMLQAADEPTVRIISCGFCVSPIRATGLCDLRPICAADLCDRFVRPICAHMVGRAVSSVSSSVRSFP